MKANLLHITSEASSCITFQIQTYNKLVKHVKIPILSYFENEIL